MRGECEVSSFQQGLQKQGFKSTRKYRRGKRGKENIKEKDDKEERKKKAETWLKVKKARLSFEKEHTKRTSCCESISVFNNFSTNTEILK